MSYLTGGGRAAYRLDLEIIKSPSTSWASNSSSPSSTLSESSNCPHSISTRKPRTPRKRPNQTYNEAAALLSTAHPKIFPTKNLSKFTKSSILSKTPFFFEPSDLLTPFKLIDTSEFLLLPPLPERPNFSVESKVSYLFDKPCQSPGEISSSRGNFSEISDDYQQGQDFEAESILDEDVEGGIDSILGNLSVENESTTDDSNSFCYGYPVGLGFDFGYGMRRELRAIRNVDEGDWWRFPSVNVHDVNPKTMKIQAEKKKKKKVDIKNLLSTTTPVVASTENVDSSKEASLEEEPVPQPNAGLLLKLNYDNVLNAWDDKSSPFSGDSPGVESTGNDVQTRLAQIDLFSENGGIREASVLRYKEKRRTRLFSKKIRYQVRKVNADRRPRMKGRFVRTPNSPDDQEQ